MSTSHDLSDSYLNMMNCMAYIAHLVVKYSWIMKQII